MSFYSQNIDNNQRLAAAAATSMGHNADDAKYMAQSMYNAQNVPALSRDNSQNAWARGMSNGAYGYDDQSTQDYLHQASQFGIDPPSQQVMNAYNQRMYPQYGQGKRKNRKSQKKHKSRKSRKSCKSRKSRKSFGGKRSRKSRKSRKLHNPTIKRTRKTKRKSVR